MIFVRFAQSIPLCQRISSVFGPACGLWLRRKQYGLPRFASSPTPLFQRGSFGSLCFWVASILHEQCRLPRFASSATPLFQRGNSVFDLSGEYRLTIGTEVVKIVFDLGYNVIRVVENGFRGEAKDVNRLMAQPFVSCLIFHLAQVMNFAIDFDSHSILAAIEIKDVFPSTELAVECVSNLPSLKANPEIHLW